MLSFSISYPDLIKFPELWIPLKEGIGGETEVDDMDNSNVQKTKRVGPPLSTHVWAFTRVYYIPHRVLSGFSASPLMFMKIGQVHKLRENLNATKLGQYKAGKLANKKQTFFASGSGSIVVILQLLALLQAS
jgi:hypothetical protein